jgi:hypothetical protein
VKEFIRKRFHFVAVVVVAVLLLLTMFNNSFWKKSHILVWDVYGYSQYLSAGFIYKDIKDPVELYEIDSIYSPTGGSHYYGRHCATVGCKSVAFKYTMGNAVMMAPFYLTAHAITRNSNSFPADGYSEPYQFAVSLSTLFWATCGLSVLALLLLRWFTPVVTGITILLIGLGTNYFYYASLESGMTHIPAFFCFALALLAMFKWLEQKSWLYAGIFGLTTGLVALIRLPDLVFGIIPALLFVKAFFEAHGKDKKTLFLQAAMVVVVIATVFAPQMVYWKYVAGTWFHYSYLDERFYFNDPHVMDGLFSYRKGWLLYTPVMLFALAGIAVAVVKDRWLGIGILLYTAVNIYVVFSWQTWWYGGSFGARALIQSYAILAIPLAYVITALIPAFGSGKRGSKTLASAVVVLLVFFTALNLFQTYQYKVGTLHYDSMSKKAYWEIIGKIRLTKEEYDRAYNE